MKLKKATDPLQLYISSAGQGNIFALTALGQLCDDDEIPESYYDTLRDILTNLDPMNPFLPLTIESGNASEEESYPRECKQLTNALGYHASISGGNRVAQVSLADELMLQFMMEKDSLSSTEQENVLLMASTLFTMALNQGYDSKHSLERLMDVECKRLRELGMEIPSEEFFSMPVVRLVLTSL